MASYLKVTNITTPDGNNSVTFDRPLAGDGNALVGISPRNFIINGNMSQHPDGDIADFNGTEYVCAFWQALANQNGVVASSQDSSVVPTVAQSNVNSKYSLKLDVTTADTSITAGQYYGLRYHITGSDFALLHQQQVTLAFWVYATKTGTYCCSFQNSATDRSYPVEYTVSSSNTWEYKTITLTLDTSGTWLFTEADKGLTIHWMLASGSTFHGTNATWQAGKYYGTSNQVNALDSTSNNFYLSQVGLYLGGSAPTFTSPPIATVKNQVEYYVERLNYDAVSGERIQHGMSASTTVGRFIIYATDKRATPTCTSSAGDTFTMTDGSTNQTGTGTPTFTVGKNNVEIAVTRASGTWTTPVHLDLRRDSTDTTYIMFDARH